LKKGLVVFEKDPDILKKGPDVWRQRQGSFKKTSRSFYTKNRSLEGNDKVFSQGLPRLKAQRLT
jgi:hypothetical protein